MKLFTFAKFLSMTYVAALAFGCGGGGGGTDDGLPIDTSIAFVSGNVSYPSSGLTKPSPTGAGTVNKILVSPDTLEGRQNAVVHAFYYDTSGVKHSTPIQATTDASGNFQLKATDALEYADRLLSLEATFPAVTDDTKEITIRKILDMTTYATSSTVRIDPISEAMLQQLIDFFSAYGIGLSPTQYLAVSKVLEEITVNTDTDYESTGFEFDENDFYSTNTADGDAGREFGYASGSSAAFTRYGVTTLLDSMVSGSLEFKKARVVELLCMMGYTVAASNGKLYAHLPRSFFRCRYSSAVSQYESDFGLIDVSPSLIPGISAAKYGVAQYELAKGIFLVDPAAIFVDEKEWSYDGQEYTLVAGKDNLVDIVIVESVDANGDGFSNDRIYFDTWEISGLYYSLVSVPPLSPQFVSEFLSNINTSTTVDKVSAGVADAFRWLVYDTSNGFNPAVEGNYITPNIVVQFDTGGQPAQMTKAEVNNFFLTLNKGSTGKLPASAHEMALQVASGDGFILTMYPEVWLDAAYKIFEMNSSYNLYDAGTDIDPFIQLADDLTSLTAIREFVIDSTSYSSFTTDGSTYQVERTPIWLRKVENMKNFIYVGVDQDMFGSALNSSTAINLPTVMMLTRLMFDRTFRIDETEDWLATYIDNYDPSNPYYFKEINYSNVKWIDNTTVDDMPNPIQTIFASVSSSFSPSGGTWTDEDLWADIKAVYKKYSFDWTYGGEESTGNFTIWSDLNEDGVNDVVAAVTGQVVDDTTGTAAPLASASVSLYAIDWSAAYAKGALIASTTTSAWGVFSFSGLEVNKDYLLEFDSGTVSRYIFFTDPWSGTNTVSVNTGTDIDADSDGLYETFTMHMGLITDDPLPGAETSGAWQRTLVFYSGGSTTGLAKAFGGKKTLKTTGKHD